MPQTNRPAKRTGGKDRRAQLEALKRQQRAAERRKTVLAILSGVLVAGLLIAIPVVQGITQRAAKKRVAAVGYVTKPTSAQRKADCTGVRNDRQVSRDHTGKTVTYTGELPPSSGPHNPDPLPASIHFYARTDRPVIERAVHSLEHGFVIGWYDAELPTAQVAALKKVAAASAGQFIAVPWDRSTFTGNRHFVLTAWERTMRCGQVSAPVVSAFLTKYSNKTAPEPGAGGGSLTPPAGTSPTAAPRPSASKK